MTHTIETHRRSYERVKSSEKAIEAHRALSTIIQPRPKPPLERREYTVRESEDIQHYFSLHLVRGITPTKDECRAFSALISTWIALLNKCKISAEPLVRWKQN